MDTTVVVESKSLLTILDTKKPPKVLNYLQSLNDEQFVTQLDALLDDTTQILWNLLLQSSDLDHLRNIIDLFKRYSSAVISPDVISVFPFDTILELESFDQERTKWLIETYLELYVKYRSDGHQLQISKSPQFNTLVYDYVRNLPSSGQLIYIDYATTDVIDSARCLAEKIAHNVMFPSQCKDFRVHCLVLGIAGVGKSTLINVAHNENIFTEAVGGSTLSQDFASASRTYKRPRHSKEDSNSIPDTVPVEVIFTDSPGPTQMYKDVRETSNPYPDTSKGAIDSFQSFLVWTFSDIKNRPNMILYCINSSSNRISDYQYFWLVSLARFYPVILVMTNSFSSKNQDSWKQNHFSRDTFQKIGLVDQIFINSREVIEPGYTIPVSGIANLASVISLTFQENIVKYLEDQQLSINSLQNNNTTRSKLWLSCRAIWTAGVISSMSAGSIPAAWVNDAATVATISVMLSAMTTAYGLQGIIGTAEVWDLLKKAFVKIGIVQTSAIGGLIIVDQLANVMMTIPFVGTFIGSGISGTCSGIAAFLCGKIWWNALEIYRLEFKPGSDDPHEFLINSIEKASQEVWDKKSNIINELNEMIRTQQNQ